MRFTNLSIGCALLVAVTALVLPADAQDTTLPENVLENGNLFEGDILISYSQVQRLYGKNTADAALAAGTLALDDSTEAETDGA